MGEILFLYITQPEEIRKTEIFFEWILLFPDGFSGYKIFISMTTFPIQMISLSKKSSGPYFVEKDFLPLATPETIILLRPSSKTKESLKF